MPVCRRCGVDQPDEAFSAESHPWCEHCYALELEEEAAGGDFAAMAAVDEMIDDQGIDQGRWH